MPPATAMWLSLISTASSRPKRWLKPPPQRTAYFCRARSPGVVLRVQTRRVLVPFSWSTRDAVAVAMPDRWPAKFSAVRSAASTARALPVMVISAVFLATASPSRACGTICVSGASLRMTASTSGRPAMRPAARATTIGARLRILGHGRDRRDIAGAAEIFGERARDRVVDLQRRDEGVGAIKRRRRSRDIEAAHGIEHRVDP